MPKVAVNEISDYLENGLQRKRYTKSEYDEFLTSLTFTTSYNELHDADLVFEAVGKNLYNAISNQIERNVSENCIIASTTCRFTLEKNISGSSSKRRQTIGMHYSIPIEKTQILEIISCGATSPETIAIASSFGLVQKKLIVPVKNFSFIIRCLLPLASEVVRLMCEGFSPEEVDALTKSAGFHVGCVKLIDGIGIANLTCAAVNLAYDMGDRAMNEPIRILEEMVKAKFYGKSVNLGFYDYSNPDSPQINPDAIQILKMLPIKPKKQKYTSPEDCQLRIISRFVNEACFCLEEGVIASPANGDIASVFGLGFPPFKGGPFRFIDSYGAENLLNAMKRFGKAYSKKEFKPAKILQEYAKSGKKFYHPHQPLVNNKL
uniref:Uncharacterized protein n=1 Tax=Panagrolaimus sp. ES5 TaxID=591445 RepID=A0AC34G0E2_9BILA